MRRAFTVVLDDLTAQRLRELAERERRRPADQAAIYVERALADPASRGRAQRPDSPVPAA